MIFGRAPKVIEPDALDAEDSPWSPPSVEPTAETLPKRVGDSQTADDEPVDLIDNSFGGPAKLEDAIPTGDSFDSGMDALLDPAPPDADSSGVTSTGLVRRDRSKNLAPRSEGRRVASSVRSPDEIRTMLARYRSGLKGKPLNELTEPTIPTDRRAEDQSVSEAPGSFDHFSAGGDDPFSSNAFDSPPNPFQDESDTNGKSA